LWTPGTSLGLVVHEGWVDRAASAAKQQEISPVPVFANLVGLGPALDRCNCPKVSRSRRCVGLLAKEGEQATVDRSTRPALPRAVRTLARAGQSPGATVSRNRRFCDQRRSPANKPDAGVHTPCPQSTSHNLRCHRVLRPVGHLLGYARVSASDQGPPSKSTPSSTPAATGCSPRPPAAPAATGRPSSSSLTSSAPAAPWWSGSWTGWAARCATWSTPSPAWPTAGSGSLGCGRRSTPPRRQAGLPRVRRPGRVHWSSRRSRWGDNDRRRVQARWLSRCCRSSWAASSTSVCRHSAARY
jgi:hypothetical protein